MKIQQLFDTDTSTYTYLLTCPESQEAVIIDPVRDQAENYEKLLQEQNLTLRYVLDTHVHADHVTAAGILRSLTGATTCTSSAAGVNCVDKPLEHGSKVHFGDCVLETRHTPGHTNGCLTFVGHEDKVAFTGDALLIKGSGRTDFQQGSPKTLFKSVREQIFSLDDEFTLYPGHDYHGRKFTTVASEKKDNPRLGLHKSEAEFVTIMNELNLDYPRHIDHALPLNLQCGLAEVDDVFSKVQISASRIPEISVDTLRDNWGTFRIIDVREVNEYDGPLSHIHGSELIPLGTLQEAVKDFDRNRAIALVCRSGGRSGKAALMMIEMGFTRVVSMAGGMLAWNTEPPKETPSQNMEGGCG